MFDPKSSITIGYHLFFLPSGQLFDNLSTVIKTLAKAYDSPIFEPHVTLLGRIPKLDEVEIITKTKRIASLMKPFHINLREIKTEDAFFRALYCEADGNKKLQQYHQLALKIFEMQEQNAYVPHISLYYGNMPQSLKDKIIDSLSLPNNMNFIVDRVYLYRTEGDAKYWFRVGVYAFQK